MVTYWVVTSDVRFVIRTQYSKPDCRDLPLREVHSSL